VDTAELVRLYTQEHLTLRAIGVRVGVSSATVWKRLHRAGVPREAGTWVNLTCAACGLAYRRPRALARRRRHYCSDACYQATIKRNGAQYTESRVGQRKARRVVARYFTLQPTHIVHHHDGDNGNNAVVNLAVFTTHAEHMRFHRGGAAQPIWDGATVELDGTPR
jgi:hypothetical protein